MGNWCFADGVVTLEDVIKAVKSQNANLWITILADCCFSGNWAKDLKRYEGKYDEIYIRAASRPGRAAQEVKAGGLFTLELTGKRTKKQNNYRLQQCEGSLDAEYKMKFENNAGQWYTAAKHRY